MYKPLILWTVCAVCAASGACGAEVSADVIQSLKKEAQELRERTAQLEQKIMELEAKQASPLSAPVLPASTAAAPLPSSSPPQVSTAMEAKGALPATALAPSWSPAQPITLMRSGSSYMNISFDALMDFGWSTTNDVSKGLLLGDHDPIQRGFSLRNAEIALDGAVDPYFKGFANLAFKLDQQNNTDVELEEAYLLTASLPANLQLKAGQFNAEFGRQNVQHPHQWAFVDQPLVLNRMLGPDGLRNPGARLSWLLPTSFYTELFLGVFNGQGGTAFSFRDPEVTGAHGRTAIDRGLRGPGDLLYVPRLASSFELTDSQTLMVGASAAFGPNDSGTETRTQVYGLDTYWKWKSARANEGFPFVSWQTEGLYRRFQAGADPVTGLPAERLDDWGLYSQVLWGIKPRWVAGIRGEYVTGNHGAYDPTDVFRGERVRVSPNLSWYPSEFSKIRLQYNLDHGRYFDVQHSVWMQVEFLLGAHGAHKF